MGKIFFDKVSLSFGQNEIFRNLTLELNAGKVIGVIGRNGAGKSTFLKLAAKIIKPDSGVVNIIDMKSIAAVTPEMQIYDDLTAVENIKFFAKLRNKHINISELERRVGLNFGNVRAGDFSTGMKQRLKFAILLSVDADIWLLDEPNANLDDNGRAIFTNEITNSVSEGKLILLATNDKSDLEICDEIIELPIT